jgi:histone H1/5
MMVGSVQKTVTRVFMQAQKKKTAPSHPSYEQMIIKSIQDLKDKKGSSRFAISGFIMETFNLLNSTTTRRHIALNLKKMTENGQIVMGGAVGKKGSGCFKLVSPGSPKSKKGDGLSPSKTGASPKTSPAKSKVQKPSAKKTSVKKPVTGNKIVPPKNTIKKPVAKMTAPKSSAEKSIVKKTQVAFKKTEPIAKKTQTVSKKTETVSKKTETVSKKTETISKKTTLKGGTQKTLKTGTPRGSVKPKSQVGTRSN